jgi:hypothetical protein
VRYDLVFGKDLPARAGPGWTIFDVNPYQQRILCYMKDAIAALSKHNHQAPGLFQKLAAPALPADRLFPSVVLLTLQPVRRRQGEHQ